MIDFLYSIDLTVFYFFNHTISAPFFDKLFSLITSVNNWYIAYVFLLGVSFVYGGRRGKIAVLGIILLIIAADQTGYRILKEFFERIRPCNSLSDVITPIGCNGTFSFPSNHALNNFAAAMFFYKLFPKLKWVFFVTASLVAISRVYLGLHYPSDIIGGALIGLAFGYIFATGVIKLESHLDKRSEKNSTT